MAHETMKNAWDDYVEHNISDPNGDMTESFRACFYSGAFLACGIMNNAITNPGLTEVEAQEQVVVLYKELLEANALVEQAAVEAFTEACEEKNDGDTEAATSSSEGEDTDPSVSEEPGKMRRTAEALDISRQTLRTYLVEYDLMGPNGRTEKFDDLYGEYLLAQKEKRREEEMLSALSNRPLSIIEVPKCKNML